MYAVGQRYLVTDNVSSVSDVYVGAIVELVEIEEQEEELDEDEDVVNDACTIYRFKVIKTRQSRASVGRHFSMYDLEGDDGLKVVTGKSHYPAWF